MGIKIAAVLLLICLIVSVVVVSSVDANYFNCDFYMPITVVNDDSSALTNVRIQYEIAPASLIDLGMMLSNADDTYLQDGSTTLEHTVMQLSGTQSVTWTGLLTSIGGNSHKEVTLWMGYPLAGTRNQTWLGDITDYTWADDSASLDLTSSFMLQVGMTLYDMPDTSVPLAGKVGSYGLWLNGGSSTYEFSIWSGTGAAVADAVGTPNANGYYQEITYTSNSGSEPWELVADSGDDTWIGVEPGSPVVSIQSQSSFETNLVEGCTITIAATDVFFRIGLDGGSGTTTATPFVFSPQHGISWGNTQSVPSAFTTYSDAIPFAGGSDVQPGIYFDYETGSSAFCSRLWLDTDIENPGTKTTVSVAASVGVAEILTGWNDGTKIFVQASSGQDSGTPTSATCYVNGDPLYALMAAGSFGTLSVSTP